jgi:PAS domain S-box-containing protein
VKKIKMQRHSRSLENLRVRPTTTGDRFKQTVPARASRHINQGHLVQAMRDINHAEWEPWEETVAEMQRGIDRQRLNQNNRFYNALDSAHRMVQEIRTREEELQTFNEEMEANNEELEATNEEMEATNEEMEATNEELLATSEELRLAGTYARSLIEASLDTMVTIGPDGKISDVNTEAEKVTGISREELVGTDFSGYFTDPGKAEAGYRQAFREGLVRDYPLEIRRADGHVMPVLYNASVYRDEAGKIQGVFAAARDVTDQKKTEEKLQNLLDQLKGSQAQLIQAGKMGAMGTMTAGIAHELNNPMMGILNFVQYSLKHTSPDDRRYPVLQDAERETKRCSEIVQNLLTFSRMEQEGEEEYRKTSCKMILDRVLKLLSYRIEKENVLVTKHTARGTPPIWIKENNIQQVIFNLIGNALDSVDTSEKKEIRVDIRSEGKFLQLTTADTGCGIPPENHEKIFDPFFTTKMVGKGTGLGLSICHSIVASHGGEIICESDVEKGTTITVLLPIDKRREERK